MAYDRWYKTVRDQQGNAINGASCTVYTAGSSTLATIYDPNSQDSSPNHLPNPFSTTSNGRFGFMAPDGEYDVVISGGSLATQQFRVTLNGFVSGSAGSLAADLAAPTGAGMIGYLAPFPSSISRTQANKNADTVSFFEWLTPAEITAYQNGSEPQLAAKVQTACDEVSIGHELLFPPGRFKINSTVVVGPGKRLRFTGGLGNETSYGDNSQIVIDGDILAFNVDAKLAVARPGAQAFDEYSSGSDNGWIIGAKFAGNLTGTMAERAAHDQCAIRLSPGINFIVRACGFRSVGTCISLNGSWGYEISKNLVTQCGYFLRQDPEFALGGFWDDAGTDIYQNNAGDICGNNIYDAYIGMDFQAIHHMLDIHGANVIQGCTGAGIRLCRYNGALSLVGTDLNNESTSALITGNYFEDNAVAIQLGREARTLSQAVSAPKAVVIQGNFHTFQGLQVTNLRVYAAKDCAYKDNRAEAYSTTTPDIELMPGYSGSRNYFESMTGWSGHLNGDQTSVVRRHDPTYRSWVTYYVDSGSVNKIPIGSCAAYNAGTAALPFDSISTLNRFIRTVAFPESNTSLTDMTFVTVNMFDGTYANLDVDVPSNISAITFQSDGSASADGISFSSIVHSNPRIYLNISGGGKMVVAPGLTGNAVQVQNGAALRMANVKLKYTAPGSAGSRGVVGFTGARIILNTVQNLDANRPETGLYADASTIMKAVAVPLGHTTNETAISGGVIR